MTPDSSHAPAPHDASLIYVIGRVSQGIRRELRRSLADWHLSVQEYTTLSVLDARPGLSNAQLARRALIAPPSMIEILVKLEKRGLVKRRADPANERILRTELTPRARALLKQADPAVQELQDQMLAAVSAPDRHTAMNVMCSAMETLSQRA